MCVLAHSAREVHSRVSQLVSVCGMLVFDFETKGDLNKSKHFLCTWYMQCMGPALEDTRWHQTLFLLKGPDDIAGDVRRGSKKWKLQFPERTFKSKMSGLENKHYGSSRV